MLSEKAQENAREARKRYDAEHMAQLAVKLPREEAERFKAYAEEKGASVSRLLANHIRRTLHAESELPYRMKSPTTTESFTLYCDTANMVKAEAIKRGMTDDDFVDWVLSNYVREQKTARRTRLKSE